jgi:4-aminobutyrate aminotransferase-like enzyme
MSAHQFKLEPENQYLTISERPAWDLLKRLAEIHPRFAEYVFRHACGLEAVPQSKNLTRWIMRHAGDFHPVVKADVKNEKQLVLDLSVGSRLLGSGLNPTDPDAVSALIFQEMESAGAAMGIGRYGEARLLYQTEIFEVETDEMPERRTIHLGVDLFMESGAKVYAPLEGKIHSFNNNTLHLDYGPTIILAHEIDGIGRFFTLYGHLSLDSLDPINVGGKIEKGEAFARIGDSSINGGWPSHLHFQITTDVFGLSGTFPGVARPLLKDVWQSLSPDPNIILGIPAECFPKRERSREEILKLRSEHLGKNLSVSYQSPLKIVRGIGQYLISEDGQAYVDGVNNVCHVGHSHPHVVSAGYRQMGVLNTNTRYLHDNIIEYSRRLLSTFPETLGICFFVCSGSEANELALRMARAYTGQRDIITLDGAYHGNTQALIDISPYKHDGPGGKGAPQWVHKMPMPDSYRGLHRGTGPDTGAAYAGYIKKAIETMRSKEKRPAAFICESVLGCGGQMVLPDQYLEESFRFVREAGGVCIVDEVQVGFGRVGSHFWAFETQQIVPDIVTLGKPMGNGHPLAAVITTPEIADAFANGMEYFNTFGGNPVSCAIGMAVLDVIQNEGLQENALKVGKRLMENLEPLKQKFPLVGDVRGLGLFVGVELVTNREKRSPAAEHASYIANRMKDYGFLISTDGPDHNVLKLKPPLVFSEKNADDLAEALEVVLGEDRLQVG